MTKKSKLKPCPFCGDKNPKVLIEYGFFEYWISCQVCGVETAYFSTEEEVVKFWNKRSYEKER